MSSFSASFSTWLSLLRPQSQTCRNDSQCIQHLSCSPLRLLTASEIRLRTPPALFLYVRATAETSRFYDIQATSVATCCVAHVSLVFGDWIHQKSKNPYVLGANHDMTDMYIMVRVIHPVLGIHFSCVWTPLFMDWWLFSNTGNHPMFWPRIQTIRDQTPDPNERVPHSCSDLGVATLRCESWAKLIFPNFPQLDMREPTVFLAPWGHHELPLTQLTSVIASERMKITNAHSQRRNHSQRSMWPKYIYIFYIDLHRFTMIYQPSSISAQ